MKKEPKPKKNAMAAMTKGKNAKMDVMDSVKGGRGKMPKSSGKMGKW